jgi:ketosteroid isomerase-like protein
MESANLDLVRSICAGWERGDFSSAEWAHPQITYVRVGEFLPGTWTGLAGLADGARETINVFDHIRFVVDEYRELDDERILVLEHRSGRGKQSGLEIGQLEAQGAHLFHVRDGKVTRLVHYGDRERVLADLGLSLEPGDPT